MLSVKEKFNTYVMKAAFIHDHYFVQNKKENKFYDGSGGAFDYKLWSRYLAVFDSLTVVGREKVIHDVEGFVDATFENVSFQLITELSKPTDRYFKQKRIENKISLVIEQVDFVIIRVPSSLGYIAHEICLKKGIKYILEVVGCPWDAYWNHGSVLGKLIAPVEYLKLKNAVKKSNYNIYVTQEFLQSRYPTQNNSIGISNVQLRSSINQESKSKFYSEFSKDQEFKIALIGNFSVKYKGHLEALKAVEYLVNEYNFQNIKLYLVGPGDSGWVSQLVKKLQIANHIEILGTLESGSKGILPFLDGIHLYIHPSKQEGLPRVVIEALSRGRLVLGSTTAGIPELLSPDFMHRPGDWKTLAEQILKLYNNPDLWNEISNSNILKANKYMESDLQHRREVFIKKAFNS